MRARSHRAGKPAVSDAVLWAGSFRRGPIGQVSDD